jgi:uncharacterized protein DUF3300
MKTQTRIALLLLIPAVSLAQVPVDDTGKVIGSYESQADTAAVGEDGIPRLSQAELQELVGPIALYPDDLLAVVLPAAAYPLQIVEAARFLEALESDATLTPNDAWDDSIVALLNYPEVIELLNDDLDWTLRLGEAVVVQQADVVDAVEAFRDRAYAAGNLKSDEYQTVSRNDDDVIYISPVEEDVIYVPYYEPAQVVYYQPTPVYNYYPRSYPVYYYPYAAGHYFDRGFFWGVTTAFTIGWMTDSLNVYHHSYYGHPYYGRSYYNNWWYRRPSINVYNTNYVNYSHRNSNYYSRGDRWYPKKTRRAYTRREGYARHDYQTVQRTAHKDRKYEPITFRERNDRISQQSRNTRSQQTRLAHNRSGNVAVRSRDNRQQRPTAQTRDTRHQKPVTQARNARRQDTPVRSRETYQRAPTRTEHAPTRAQRAPTRTESAPTRAQRAPSQPQQRHTESRQPQQPSQSHESRGQERKSSNSGRSERRSSTSRSRSRSHD